MIPILYDKTEAIKIGFLTDCIKCEVLEERKDKFIKDMSDDEFDDMLQKLMEERQERRRKKQSDMEM